VPEKIDEEPEKTVDDSMVVDEPAESSSWWAHHRPLHWDRWLVVLALDERMEHMGFFAWKFIAIVVE
jgi:hypothetical protein